MILDEAITLLTVLAGILGWFAIIIWAAWRRFWLFGALGGMAFVTALLLISQSIGGPRPIPYGLLFGLSLFLSAGASLIGIVELIIKTIAHIRDG